MELHIINREMARLVEIPSDCRILEKNGEVRTVFIESGTNPLIDDFARLEKMLVPMEEILDDNVYVHQIKLNVKHGNGGDVWQWHQDFVYWKIEDGMQRPHAINAAIYLDDVTEFNGPVYVVPGSQHYNAASETNNILEGDDAAFDNYQTSKAYMSTLTAKLKYTITPEALTEMTTRNGLVSSKGPAGSLLLFHANLFHASSNNLSPWHRRMLFVTYNAVRNKLESVESPRPTFIANRNFKPLQSIPNETFVKSFEEVNINQIAE